MNHLHELIADLGLLPQHAYSLYFPLAALAMWILFLPIAYLRKIKLFYNGSVRAAFLEEIVFRGLVYGITLYVTKNALWAVVVSSVTFGLLHLRNLWWASWRRSWRQTFYAGLTAGPVFGLIRFLTGDIYLGILVHFLHNFVVIMTPRLLGGAARTPTDEEIRLAHSGEIAKVDR